MTDGSNLVTIRDIDVPFWRIVMILVKWSIASIPAMIILISTAGSADGNRGWRVQHDRPEHSGSADAAGAAIAD